MDAFRWFGFTNTTYNPVGDIRINDRPWTVIKSGSETTDYENLVMIQDGTNQLLIHQDGLVLVGNKTLTTCYVKFKLGNKIKSPKGTIGTICGNVYRIHNNGNIYTDYDIDNVLHPIMLWSSRNNEYAELVNRTSPIDHDDDIPKKVKCTYSGGAYIVGDVYDVDSENGKVLHNIHGKVQIKWDNDNIGSKFEIYEEPVKELTPLEICRERFKVGDCIISTEGTIGIITEALFEEGITDNIYCYDKGKSLSVYSRSKNKYAIVIESTISSVSNDGKWLDKVNQDICIQNVPKPIVKSPEQIRHENWLDSMHSIGIMPVDCAWEQINPSKRQVHNNSDQLISAGVAMMSQSLPFKKSPPKENKIDIPNEPVEIFIKRKK